MELQNILNIHLLIEQIYYLLFQCKKIKLDDYRNHKNLKIRDQKRDWKSLLLL